MHPVDPTIEVAGDPVRLAQVIENLLINAAKYTPDGGQIDVSAEAEGSQVVIAVRDTGIGIAPEMLGRVFELFAQADTSLDRSEGGLGIGLTLADRLTRLHGGVVAAHSRGPGTGSTFTVSLPRVEHHAVSAAAPERGDRESRWRVLVVDDNVDSAEMLKMLLEMSGHEVRLAHDGLSVMAAALEFRPDVILLDIGLPGRDGYQLIKDLRAHPDAALARVIATTGYGRDEDRARCLAAGFDEHLTKPVDLDLLMELL